MKTVTVIICTYNSEKTIYKTLNSIFNQQGINELFELDVIVIDDASTDNTVNIVSDLPILLIQNSTNSGGPNKGRNIGLENAKGDFICITDHDDVWVENKIQIQLEASLLAPIVSGGFKIFNTQNNKITFRGGRINQTTIFERNQTFKQLLSKNYNGQTVYLSGLLFHKDLKWNRFEEKFGFLDWDWGLRLFENNSSVEVKEILFTRIIDGNNLSLNENYRIKDFQEGLSIVNTYEDRYPKETAKGKNKIYGTIARYYYFVGEMPKARSYFKLSSFNLKNILFFLTTYFGHRFVRKYVHFFI
jgi:glycosyltransferase involved in cell wall biosynthesis